MTISVGLIILIASVAIYGGGFLMFVCSVSGPYSKTLERIWGILLCFSIVGFVYGLNNQWGRITFVEFLVLWITSFIGGIFITIAVWRALFLISPKSFYDLTKND